MKVFDDLAFGVCYYPEHWPKEQWPEHVRLMEEAGINTIRTGDFSWGVLEKEEGKYDFSLIDEAMELWEKAGIKVIMCTPTAGPPKWLVNKYDILQRDRYGRPEGFGARREACTNSRIYREKSAQIVEALGKHFQGNKNIIAWQIDNEFGCHESTRCYCENCRKKFGKWLEKKYKTIDALNEQWGTVFWSLQFSSFEDIILPTYNSCEPENAHSWSHNPSLDLEFRRFSSDSWVDFQKMQIDILRKYTAKPITHNFMGHFSDLDYYKMAEDLDFVEWDDYPDNQWGGSEYEYVSMANENMRGVKDRNFIVAEQQAGPAGWDQMGATPEPGQIRLWTHQAIAHGGEGTIYFRFKTLHYGMEQYWYGLLDHDGIPRRRYYEVKQTGEELKKLSSYILDAKNDYDALIVKTYDDVWAHEIKSHSPHFDYRNLLYAYYKANADLNVTTAVSLGNYDKYKVVYMPGYNIVDPEQIRQITEYVQNGGTLVTTFRSGTRNQYNNLRTDTLPGAFRELAGIEVEEFDVPRKSTHIQGLVSSCASTWCDVIKPATAKVLCTYSDRYFAGKAAVTVNQYGKGTVYYVGCDLEQDALKELIRYISQNAGIQLPDLPDGVELVKRENYCILLNHNEEEKKTDIRGVSLLSGQPFDGVLPGYGVEYLRNEN